MKALISRFNITLLELAAFDADQGIQEILDRHLDVLVNAGLSVEWLLKYGEDYRRQDPKWRENVRIYDWWEQYGIYESDFKNVYVYIVDPQKARSAYTGIIFSPNGEYLIFSIWAYSLSRVDPEIYNRIDEGLTDFIDDTQEIFSKDWVSRHRKDKIEWKSVSGGHSDAYISAGEGDEDFNYLRIHIFDNRFSKKSLHDPAAHYGEPISERKESIALKVILD